MKQLSQMTREELWALNLEDICLLMEAHLNFSDEETFAFGRNHCLVELEKYRLELQQDSAEARQDSQQER